MIQLQVEQMTLSFGGLWALDHVSFQVERGSIFSIIGPNGAGKSTIFNCITGIYRPDTGRALLEKEDITRLRPYHIAKKGIARTFQNLELFSHMTTMDNILLGRHIYMKTGVWSAATMLWRRSKAARDEISHRQKAEVVIDFLDLQAARDKPVASLPYGTQKLVELARALALEPKLLFLDEPSSGMNSEEKGDLLFWIRDIRDLHGVTIVLVEHDMNLVMDISDRVLALNHGRVIAEGSPEEIQCHPAVLEAYLGEQTRT